MLIQSLFRTWLGQSATLGFWTVTEGFAFGNQRYDVGLDCLICKFDHTLHNLPYLPLGSVAKSFLRNMFEFPHIAGEYHVGNRSLRIQVAYVLFWNSEFTHTLYAIVQTFVEVIQ